MLRKSCLALLVFLALQAVASAELKLPSLFTDHMVLQRDRMISVWGRADANAGVSVAIAGANATATANQDGDWRLALPPLAAGGPYELTVKTSTGDETKVADVLVGDVWVCSGQSNMAWPVRNSNNAKAEIADSESYPQIRLLTVPRKTQEDQQADFEGQWSVCGPDTVPNFSAVAYFFGRAVHLGEGVPIGLINTSYGGTPAEAWTSHGALEREESLQPLLARWEQAITNYDAKKAESLFANRLTRWREAVKKAKAEGKTPPARPRPPQSPAASAHRPASLYNAMIAPLTKFSIRGAIWYQGESNAGRAYQYRTIFPTMVRDWRRVWGQGNFPFLFVQLANFRQAAPQPGESAWAELREAQSMTLATLPNMAQAVTIDIGDANDIHPRNKQDVGLRLALCAMAGTYGESSVSLSPRFTSFEIQKDKIELRFQHIAGGLQARAGQPLKGFAIAGEDKKFVWANATTDGATVTVSHPEVANPVAVRYGWAENPDCNLVNTAGLPASPFRTDDWPGLTVNSH